MSPEPERRRADRPTHEAVPAEFLALLALCGGEVREGDLPGPEERRPPGRPYDRRQSDRRSTDV